MAQQLTQKTVNSFTGGLITEASPLNFPDNATSDELNCEHSRKGVLSRRKGIEYETGFELSTFTLTQGDATHELTWENVSNESGVEFLVLQIGSTVYFYDKSSIPLSAGIKSFSLNLAAYSAGNGKSVSGERISGDSLIGKFVVASPAIESLVLSYDEDTDTISVTQLDPLIRDFEWQGDTIEYSKDIAPAAITDTRLYDTYNAGWIDQTKNNDPVLNEMVINNVYPALNLHWSAGKDATDADRFNGNYWWRTGAGNTLIGNGHFILHLYNKDRTQAVIDDPKTNRAVTLAAEVETARFSAVASYAGRAWFSGLESEVNGSRIYFTKVVKNVEDFNKFYQANDPTSDVTSDLLDNDGGEIVIPNASRISAMFEWGNVLLVFAENGVWSIRGVDGIFKASEYIVSRVRDVEGLTNPLTLVDVEGNPIWWGPTGIYTVSPQEVTGDATGNDISKGSIQTFWEDIGAEFRAQAKGAYDARRKRVYWMYGSSSVDYKYNHLLILDTVLQAFIPWTITDEATNTNYLVGATYFTGTGAANMTENVISNGELVVVLGEQVVLTQPTPNYSDSIGLKFVVRDGDTGKITFADFTDADYLDWSTRDYSTYADVIYHWDGDISMRKSSVYITTYFDVTETGWTGSEALGYDPINASSCFMKAYWDLKTAASSNRQVYRFKRPILVDSGDLTSFDYPYDSVVTRNKILGRGRVLKLRFEGETGKDFQLQGYEVINAKNSGF